MRHLDGHLTSQVVIVAFVHDGETTRTQLAGDPVTTETCRKISVMGCAPNLTAGTAGKALWGEASSDRGRGHRGQVWRRFRPPPQCVSAVWALPKMGVGLNELVVGQCAAQEPADLVVAQVRAHGGPPFPTQGSESACPSSSSSRRTRSRALYTPESVRPVARHLANFLPLEVRPCEGLPGVRLHAVADAGTHPLGALAVGPELLVEFAGQFVDADRVGPARENVAGRLTARCRRAKSTPRCRLPGAASHGMCRGRAARTPRGPARRPACAARRSDLLGIVRLQPAAPAENAWRVAYDEGPPCLLVAADGHVGQQLRRRQFRWVGGFAHGLPTFDTEQKYVEDQPG